MRRAEWIVDVGPGAGAYGGEVLYSGPLAGLREGRETRTSPYVFADVKPISREPRVPRGWLHLHRITRNNLRAVDVAFPLGVLTAVTGVSGAGKSSLVSSALTDLLADRVVGQKKVATLEDSNEEPVLDAVEITVGR